MNADIAAMIDIVTSLTAIIEEESDKLAAPGRYPELAELAAAKGRLVAVLETQTARRSRETPDWTDTIDAETRDQLAASIATLRDVSVTNAALLCRQIELSTEMMGVVAAEAQRLLGSTSATYGANGGLSQSDQATPISLNAKL